jgi:hypothetical protein
VIFNIYSSWYCFAWEHGARAVDETVDKNTLFSRLIMVMLVHFIYVDSYKQLLLRGLKTIVRSLETQEEKVGHVAVTRNRPKVIYEYAGRERSLLWACGYGHVTPSRLDMHLNTAENQARRWVAVQTSPHPQGQMNRDLQQHHCISSRS